MWDPRTECRQPGTYIPWLPVWEVGRARAVRSRDHNRRELEASVREEPPEAEPDDKSDPLSASSPEEALAMAIKFLEGLKPPDVEEPEEAGS